MTQSAPRRRAILLLVLTGLLWSSGGVLLKIISWQPLSILSARGMIASAVCLIYLRRLDCRWTRVQVVGALAYSSTQLLFIAATKLTTAANAIVLNYTSLIFVALLGTKLLGERPSRPAWWSLLCILTGILLCFGDDLTFSRFWGNASGLTSGLTLAVFVLSMRSQKAGVPAETVLLGNILNALVGLPLVLREVCTLPSLGIILFLGLFQVGISFVLYSVAVKYVNALESTLIPALELVLNPLWAFLLLGETPGRLALLGSVFILGGVLAVAVASASGTGGLPPSHALPTQVESGDKQFSEPSRAISRDEEWGPEEPP